MISHNGYTIVIQNYYDTALQYYRNILILNKEPIGPLNKYIKKIPMPYLSPFKNNFSNDMNNTNNNNTNKDDYYEFVPFFIQEDYTGRDNLTLLKGENMDMIVEILGYYNDEPIIYPFGFERNFIKFEEMPIVLFIDNKSNNNDIKIYGLFKLDDDGIYKIYLNEIYDNDKLITLDTLSFPLKLQCNVKLIL